MSTLVNFKKSLKEGKLNISTAAAKLLYAEEYGMLQDLIDTPPTEAQMKGWGVKGRSLIAIVQFLAKPTQVKGSNVDNNMANFFAGMTNILPKQKLADKPWQDLLAQLEDDPKNKQVLEALLAKDEIQVVNYRTKRNWALTKKGTFLLKGTVQYIQFLQDHNNSVKKRFPNGIRVKTLESALGIVAKYVQHPFLLENLDDGVSTNNLTWLGSDNPDWDDDWTYAMCWAAGKSGHGMHQNWNPNDGDYDVHEGLLAGKGRYMAMVDDYQAEVEDNGLTVDMTVKPGKQPQRRQQYVQKRQNHTRDTVYGDEFTGDKIYGNKVEGDQIILGNVTNGFGNAFGRNATSNVTNPPTLSTRQLPDERDLVKLMGAVFSTGDLENICFDLKGVSYEDLPGQGPTAKSRELVEFMLRRNRLEELIMLVSRLRPHTNFWAN